METTLFDRRGFPVAYLAADDSVYLWNGQAAAFIHDDLLRGWNGLHLGFFVDGVVYDTRGKRIGFVRSTCPCATHEEPPKYRKLATRTKWEPRTSCLHPTFLAACSDEPLVALLSLGLL